MKLNNVRDGKVKRGKEEKYGMERRTVKGRREITESEKGSSMKKRRSGEK